MLARAQRRKILQLTGELKEANARHASKDENRLEPHVEGASDVFIFIMGEIHKNNLKLDVTIYLKW